MPRDHDKSHIDPVIEQHLKNLSMLSEIRNHIIELQRTNDRNLGQINNLKKVNTELLKQLNGA